MGQITYKTAITNKFRKFKKLKIALLTSPKVLRDNLKRFAAVSLIDELDIAIISTRTRAFLPGRQHQSIIYNTSPIFWHCLQNNFLHFSVIFALKRIRASSSIKPADYYNIYYITKAVILNFCGTKHQLCILGRNVKKRSISDVSFNEKHYTCSATSSPI